MDLSAVKTIVDRELEPLMARFGIGHWRIVVSYAPTDADEEGWQRRGRCSRMVDYNQAHITLNSDAFEDEADCVKTLRHELLHIVAAPWDIVWNAAWPLVKDDPIKAGLLDSIHTHAMEQAIVNLERMYRGLTDDSADDAEPAAVPSAEPLRLKPLPCDVT